MELEKWMELILDELGINGMRYEDDPAADLECLFAYKKGKKGEDWEFTINKHRGGISIFMQNGREKDTKSLKNAVNFVKANI